MDCNNSPKIHQLIILLGNLRQLFKALFSSYWRSTPASNESYPTHCTLRNLLKPHQIFSQPKLPQHSRHFSIPIRPPIEPAPTSVRTPNVPLIPPSHHLLLNLVVKPHTEPSGDFCIEEFAVLEKHGEAIFFELAEPEVGEGTGAEDTLHFKGF